MFGNFADKIGKISSTIELVTYLANKYVEHKAQEEGISVEEALAKATENYEAAKTENDALKKLGH